MSSAKTPRPGRFLVPLILSAIVLALYWRTPGFLMACEWRVQDLLLGRALVLGSAPSTCVILTGDESTQTIAGIITSVAREKPRAIGVCECLPGADATFERAVRNAGKTVMGYGVAFGRGGDAGRSLSVVEKSRVRFSTNPWGKPRHWNPSPQASIECVNIRAVDVALGSGFSSVIPGADGITRAVPLVAWANDAPYQGFTVALLAVSLGARRVTLKLKGEAVEGLEMDGLRIGTDPKGRLLFQEYAGGIMVCSAADLLVGKLSPGHFSGKIVIIGSDRSRLRTRAALSIPEAVIQATAVENALRNDYLRRSRGVGFIEVALIIGIPFATARLRGWRRMTAALGATVLLAVGAVIAAVFFRQETRIFFPVATAVLSWLMPFPAARS